METCSHLSLTLNTAPPVPTAFIYPTPYHLLSHPPIVESYTACSTNIPDEDTCIFIMVVWNEELERKLLSLIIDAKKIKLSAADWNAIAAKMGSDFNWNACRYEVKLALNIIMSYFCDIFCVLLFVFTFPLRRL